MRLRALLPASALALFACGSGANAGVVVFSDNFNSYKHQMDWTPASVWTVTKGSVDLFGMLGFGGYVDLDGSTWHAGTLQTDAWFAPGWYTLTFDLGGNARGDIAKTTTITLGDWTKSIKLLSSSPFKLYTFTFHTKIGGNLSFADNDVGDQNIGNLLDNVTLADAPAAPEISTWAMMALGFAGLGGAAFRRGGRKTTRAIVSFE
jgi:hypothetical protein